MERTNTISSHRSLFDLRLKEVWDNRDLLFLFIKRDITVTYKQTILGPLWFVIQPLLTTVLFILVFWKIAGISTNGIPPILFYLGGITIWNYFSDSLRLTSDTFTKNANLFGKVYFPRIITPLSIVASNFIKFLIQFSLFLGVFIYYLITERSITPNSTLLLLPFYVFIVALLALGFGLIISSLTTKYRDLTFLIQFGIQLWMYITPVIYPISKIPDRFRFAIEANPLSSIVEAFKYGFTGSGSFNPEGIIYSSIFAITLVLISLIVFNRTERNFIDTV